MAHWTKSKNPDSPRFRHDMAERICGYPIKYITEKHGDNEDVIGRSGSLNIKRETDELIVSRSGSLNIKRETDELIVSTPSETILRCDINDLQAWILMSNDGVVITAPDKEHGGVERTIVVHYVYYRK